MRPISSKIGGVLFAMGAVFLFFGGRAWVQFSGMPERFEVKVVIRADLAAGLGTNSATHDPYYMQTEFEVMRSDMILDQVIAALDLNTVMAKTLNRHGKLNNAETRRLLKQSIQLSPNVGVNRIEARVCWDDKAGAVNIANGIADAYLNHHQEKWNQVSTARSNVFQAQLEELNRKIESAQKQTKQLQGNPGPAELAASDATAQRAKAVIENQAELVQWQN